MMKFYELFDDKAGNNNNTCRSYILLNYVFRIFTRIKFYSWKKKIVNH